MSKKEPDSKRVDVRAHFIITTSWDKEINSDIDTWLQDSAKHLVFYRSKTDGLMDLDRDDTGNNNDTIILLNGDVIKYSENRENIMIRGIVPGEYILNLHMFNSNGAKFPIGAQVVLYDVKQGIEIKRETVIFKREGEEITAFRFTLSSDGKVSNINKLEKKFIGIVR